MCGASLSRPGGRSSGDPERSTRFFEERHGRFLPSALGERAEQEGHLRRGPDGRLYRYHNGVYRPDGDAWLESFVREALGRDFRASHVKEVRAFVNAKRGNELPAQPPMDYINVLNGLLYWRESPPRLEPHTPDALTTIQIPVVWDPKADCPNIQDFFEQVLPEDTHDFIYEWLGYLLLPTSALQKALLLQGPSRTGKSTLLLLTSHLLGEANVAHLELQQLADNRFAAAELYGKLANICADLDVREVRNSGMFKMLVAGDALTADRKYGKPFTFRPYARLMFSANEAPGASDQSDAYYIRWLVLPMCRQVEDFRQDPGLLRRLTSKEELSGLLRLAVEGLQRVMRRGRFVEPTSMREAAHRYRTTTDTVLGFAEERLTLDPQSKVRSSEVYESYQDWCRGNGRMPLGSSKFHGRLEELYQGRNVERVKVRGHAYWKGLKLTREPSQFLAEEVLRA
jgi:putative DNA primase/helicase